MPSALRRLACALLLLAQPWPALAWGAFGHTTVAEIALAYVTPATRAAVDRLLAQTDLLETPRCPAETLAQVASWADCVRDKGGDRFSYTSSWHQQDVDACHPFDLKPPCKDGNCVSTQVARQVRLLKDKTLPVREQVMALMLLIHFAGDLSQPLHGVERVEDKGGNDVNAAYGIARGSKITLHKIWDVYLAERAITTPTSLVHVYSPADKARLAAGNVEDWSRESWDLARGFVYPTALGPDYCGKPEYARGAVSEASIEALIPVVRDQIVKGGLRLARLLDEAFAGSSTPR
jgi:hypothetical protein